VVHDQEVVGVLPTDFQRRWGVFGVVGSNIALGVEKFADEHRHVWVILNHKDSIP
jgi:hypothetical protein